MVEVGVEIQNGGDDGDDVVSRDIDGSDDGKKGRG